MTAIRRRADQWNDLARVVDREIFRRTRSRRENFIAPSTRFSVECDLSNGVAKCARAHTYIHSRTYISRLVSSIRCLQSLIEPLSKSRSSPTLQNGSFIATPRARYMSALSHCLQLRVIGKLLPNPLRRR